MPRINEKIFEAIKSHPSMEGLSESTIYRRILKIRNQIGTWHSKRAAAAYLASTLRIDVYKLLRDRPDQLEELQKIGAPPSVGPTKIIREIKDRPPIKVDEKIVETFLLPRNLSVQANKMSDVYPHFYVFENLLRYAIMSTLTKKHGKNWWNVVTVSKEIRDQVEMRKKAEGRNRWVGKRGSHEVFYTDLGDLGLIINSNYNDFKEVFPNLTWIKSRVDDVETSRNILAHNNPLPTNETKRIELYLKDLQNQLAEKLK